MRRVVAVVVIGCGVLMSACSSGGSLEAGDCINDPLDELMEDPTVRTPEIETVACGSSRAELRLVEEVGPMSLEDPGPECPEGSRGAAVNIEVGGGEIQRWCVEEV